MPNQAVKVRRYFVFNAFPFAHRKHLATAQLLGLSELNRPGLSYLACDEEAAQELTGVLEGLQPTNPNTMRFRDYDILETQRKD